MEEQVDFRLNGITKHHSDRNTAYGDLEDCINIEKIYDEIHPVFPAEKVSSITNLLFVHKLTEADYFFYKSGSNIMVAKRTSGVFASGVQVISLSGETVNGIEAIGNVVVISTDLKLRYLLKNDTEASGYKYLGDQIPFPIIQPRLSTDKSLNFTGDACISEIGDVRSVYEYIEQLKVLFSATGGSESTTNIEATILEELGNRLMEPVIKRIATNEADGYFTFPFFVRYALRLYDGTLTKHSQPFLLNPSTFTDKFKHAAITYNNKTDSGGAKQSFKITREKLFYDIQSTAGLSNWSDIVTSVDIFISAPIYTLDVTKKPKDYKLNSDNENIGGDTLTYIYDLAYKTKDKTLEAIAGEGNFYMLESIQLSDLTVTTRNANTAGKLSAIVQQERMTDDYETHHRLTAKGANSYNNRLLLTGVSKQQTDGFYTGSYGNVNTTINGKEITKTTPGHDLIENSMYLFYPDANATQIKSPASGSGTFLASLKRHPSLNGSYYINPELKKTTYTTTEVLSVPLSTTPIIEDVSHKLYSSEIFNPFLFNPTGINSMPGRVLGVGTTTEPLSQGQFGQYPLYVFTDKGIWALEIANNGSYSSKQIISREVCSNPKSITQLKREIAFITEKGLCIISGKDTEVISSVLEDANYMKPVCDISELLSYTGNSALEPLVNTEPKFITYMQGAKPVYDPVNERIYLYNQSGSGSTAYTYIFNLQSKTWSKTDEQFIQDCNAYPEVFLEKSDGIYQQKLLSTTTQRKIFYITRSIQLEELLFIFEKLKQKGVITKIDGVKNVLALYGSRDGVNYSIVASSETNILKMRGSGYKFYKLAFSGTLKNTDIISGIVGQYQLKYTNKLR